MAWRGLTIIRHRVRPLFAEDIGLDPYVVDDTGRAWDLPARVSSGLRSHLDTPGLVWVSAAEPGGLGSNLDRRLQAVALLSDGTTLWDSVVLDDGVLKGADEISMVGTWSDYGDPRAPSPRTEFFPVFSRSVGGVFVIGGIDSATFQRIDEIYFYRFGVGWSWLPAPESLGTVFAATLSPADGKLWLLHGSTSSVRLSRVDPWTAATEVLGTWSRNAAVWNRQFLAVDRDGNVLLVSASATLNNTKVGRVRAGADGHAYLSQIHDLPIPYTSDQPLVDTDELGFIVRDGGDVSSIARISDLVGNVGNYSPQSFFQ